MDILSINYEKKDVADRLKWTLEEYQNGKWKTGLSKIYEITSLKKTDKRVKEVAEILDISEELAGSYFEQSCDQCGKKKLNPHEVAMNLKLFGRQGHDSDNRKYLCRKCIQKTMNIKQKEYSQMVRDFTDGGCNLF